MATRKKPNATDVHVGSRVRLKRMQLGLSQETLGKAVGLTFQQIQKYEKGVNRMGSSRLQQMSDIMKVPVAWFFEAGPGADRSGYKNGEAAYTKFVSEQQGLKLMEGWATLVNQERLAIIQLVRTLGSRE